MVGAWPDRNVEKPFEPWACPRCPGNMIWFASDLRDKGQRIEHKFACDKCGEIEHITMRFEPQPPAAPVKAA